MKKKLLLFVTMILIGSIHAQTFTVDGLSYTVTAPGEVQIDSYQCYTGALVIPSIVTDMSIDYSVTSIGNYAFYNCSGLTSVVVPNSVTYVGSGAFRDCHNLTSASLPNTISIIKNETFLYCNSLTSINIPNSVTTLEIYAFYGCTSLTSVSIPNSVITLGDYSFFQCSSLPSITIPNSVTNIGGRAFANCTGLTSIKIPSSVTTIGDYAFRSCTGLTSVVALPITPVSINSTVFNLVNISAIPLYVQTGSVATYSSAPIWQNFNSVSVYLVTFYQDLDDDGFGNSAVTIEASEQPVGYTTVDGDCNDNDVAINPGAAEICYNNIDDNCDGNLSEGCTPISVSINNPGTITNFSTALSAFPYSYAGAVTRDYKFEIKNMQTNEVREFIQTGTFARFFTIPTDIRGYNTTYEIRAAAVINGEELNYFVAPISVTSTGISTVSLSSFSCNSTLSRNGATISANPVQNIINYTYRLRLTSDNGPSPTYYYAESPSRFISLNYFAGLTVTSGTSYSIAVQTTINNNGEALTSDYGAECTVSTPGVAPLTKLNPDHNKSVVTSLTVFGYPNPFADNFKLDVKTSSSSLVTVIVYDMLGRQIETHSMNVTEMNNTTIGDNYPTGVYNVIVSQNEEISTIRMIKR